MSQTITTKNYKKLSMQISLNEMSFCCFDTLNQKITDCHSIAFSILKPLEDQLWKAFVNHPELMYDYDEIVVLHDNSLNTFVPTALFDEEFLGSYLQYNTKVFDTDFFAYDTIENYDINNVHVPFMDVNNFLIDRYGSFDYKNTNSILVSKLLDASRNVDDKQVFVHIQATHFEIIVVRNQKLLLFNSFEYNTPEDFLYYLLFTFEQLQLNPEFIKVSLLGKINEMHPCYEIAYKYIRNVVLFEPFALKEKWDRSMDQTLQHYILFNS
ncbi:DUF3822 family protein [Flavobacterium beibuense]|nr:DUF3822 family protein [Flavobacterium beibuense]